MNVEVLLPAAIPSGVIVLLGFLAKDKLSSITASIAALVIEVKELRKDLAEIAVLRVRVERCETEIGDLRDRMREVELPRRGTGT